MQRTCGLWLALILVGCQPPVQTETVESLAADPERLKQVQRQCRLDRARMGDGACEAASEAFRRRFMGGAATDRAPPKAR